MESRFYTVQAVVDSCKNDAGETGTHVDFRFLQWALEGYREAHLSTPMEIKTVKLKMNAYGAVNLPQDFVTFTKVGVKYGRKVVIVGLADDSGDVLVYQDAVVPSQLRMKELSGAAYDFQNCNGSTLRGYCFGNYAGSFERCGNQLQFHSNLHGLPVVLEYISDGISECGDTILHPFWYEYLRTYIHYRRVKADDNASQSLKYEKEQDMKRAKLTAAMRGYAEQFTPEYVVRLTKVAGNPVIHTL